MGRAVACTSNASNLFYVKYVDGKSDTKTQLAKLRSGYTWSDIKVRELKLREIVHCEFVPTG